MSWWMDVARRNALRSCSALEFSETCATRSTRGGSQADETVSNRDIGELPRVQTTHCCVRVMRRKSPVHARSNPAVPASGSRGCRKTIRALDNGPTIRRIASHRRSSTHRRRGHAVNPPPGPGPKSQISGARRGEAVLRRNPPHPCRLPVAVLATECPPHRWVLEPLAVEESPEKACIPGFARRGTRSTERLCCPLLACGALRRRTRRGATGTYSCVPRRTMAGSTASDAPRRSAAT